MLGKILKQRYQVVQFLNAGVFGQTYIAEDIHQLGNPRCVVKHLKVDASTDANHLQMTRRRFKIETDTLRQLGNHEQIPQLLDCFEENQEFYLVQEFIPGHPLSTELPDSYRSGFEASFHKKRWTEDQVVQLLQEVLYILEFVHDRGFIHCDLKPNNLIRRVSDGKLFLIDFGTVQPIRREVSLQRVRADAESLSIPSHLSHSPLGYIPAEQLIGNSQPNSDIFALGIMAIQALTSLEPLQLQVDFSTGEVMWESFATISPQLATILRQMVCYDYQNRYQTASEVLHALQQMTARSRDSLVVGALVGGSVPEIKTFPTVHPTTNNQQPITNSQLPLIAANNQPSAPNTHSFKASPLVTGFAVGMVANSLVLTFGLYSLLHAFPRESGTDALFRATQEYQTGDLAKAIALAKSVPANSPAYFEAQAAIREWQQDWQTADTQFQATELAFNQARWQDVFEEARKIPYISYWQKQIKPLVQQAQLELEAEAKYLLQKAYERAAERDFTRALRFLRDIPKQTAEGAKIQQKLAEYTEKQRVRADYLLQQAYDRATVRDFTGALNFIKQIPKDTPAYTKAVPKVAEYVVKQRLVAESQKSGASPLAASSPQVIESSHRQTTKKFEALHPGNRLQEVNIF